PFCDGMGARLRAGDLVVTRAGATTAADLLVVGRPAIFVPIPHGGSREEQRRNAETLAEAGVGWCVPEPELTAEKLSALLGELFASTIKLPQAAAVAASMGRPRAAVELADLVERMLARGACDRFSPSPSRGGLGSRLWNEPLNHRDSDVPIFGGGHNGLVCAAYLAAAGLTVRVLERRGVVGGAAVTEEFFPGFRNSVASYTVSLLNPRVIADLRLAE